MFNMRTKYAPNLVCVLFPDFVQKVRKVTPHILTLATLDEEIGPWKKEAMEIDWCFCFPLYSIHFIRSLYNIILHTVHPGMYLFSVRVASDAIMTYHATMYAHELSAGYYCHCKIIHWNGTIMILLIAMTMSAMLRIRAAYLSVGLQPPATSPILFF